jgi:hypothetical protein
MCLSLPHASAPKLIVLGLAAALIAGCGGSDKPTADPDDPTVTIEAPIDVRMTYDISDWTFERSGTQVRIEAVFYEGQDGSEAAKNVCLLTLGDLDDVESVVVTWQNGREGCKR